jgi:hypothetical protein
LKFEKLTWQDAIELMSSNQPLPTDATIVSIAPQDDDFEDSADVVEGAHQMINCSITQAQPCITSKSAESNATNETAPMGLESDHGTTNLKDAQGECPSTAESLAAPDLKMPAAINTQTLSNSAPVLPRSESSDVVPAKKNKAAFKKRAAEFDKKQGRTLDAFAAPKDRPSEVDVVHNAGPQDLIIDSWEDVGAVASSTPSPMSSASMDVSGTSLAPIERRVYAKERLLELRSMCYEAGSAPNAALPSFIVEKSTSCDPRAGRRLGPGGATRSSGAGAGGGGSGGGRYGGSMDDPRRDQSLRHNGDGRARHRKPDHSTTDKWDRGQRVKQKDSLNENWGPEPVEPLKTSVHRWDRKRKAADTLEVSISKVTSILNKMTPDNFEKLASQLCELEMTSSEMLRRVIGVLFDKAVDEPHFAVVYAALCARLAETTRVWPFIRSVKDENAGTWSWVADLDVDTTRLIPLDEIDSVEQFLDTPESAIPAEIGVGQLQLQPSDCFLKNDTLVSCYYAAQRPGVVRISTSVLQQHLLRSSIPGVCSTS